MNKEIQLTREHAKMLTNKPTYKAAGHLKSIIKLFKDKIPAKQIAGMYPEYFTKEDPNKIYTVKAKLVQLGLAEKCPTARVKKYLRRIVGQGISASNAHEGRNRVP